MEGENQQNGMMLENGESGLDNSQIISDNIVVAEDNDTTPSDSSIQSHKLRTTECDGTEANLGIEPAHISSAADVTVNGEVSNGDYDALDLSSDVQNSSAEGQTLKMSSDNTSDGRVDGTDNASRSVGPESGDKEELFFDPAPEATEAEQWHEASDNTEASSTGLTTKPSAADSSQSDTHTDHSLLTQVNTEHNSECIASTGAKNTALDNNAEAENCHNNEIADSTVPDRKGQQCEQINGDNEISSTDLQEASSPATIEENHHDLTENAPGNDKKIALEQSPASGEDSVSSNPASIDLGKFGEISLSTQVGLSSQMAEVADLATGQKGEHDEVPVDGSQQADSQPTETVVSEESLPPASDPLPAVACDQPASLPYVKPLDLVEDMDPVSDVHMEKAIGSERRSMERYGRSYDTSPGHVEIDLSAQLENIFTDSPKASTKVSDSVFSDVPKAKSLSSNLLTKKENADSGVDNDDEFDTLDKEIVQLRERYRNTQDRIHKALQDEKEKQDEKYVAINRAMSPETAYANFRAKRIGSAPVLGETYDIGIGGRLSSKIKDDASGVTNVKARRMVADQADLCSKLRNTSQSFDELEEEIRSLKYDFLETQARRDRFFEEYDRELQEEDEKEELGSYGVSGIYGGGSTEEDYYNYYLSRAPPPKEKDEFEFRLPSATRRPWSSYGRSYTEDPGMYSSSSGYSRDYRAEEPGDDLGGYRGAYALPLYQRDRPRPKDRVSSLDETKRPVPVPEAPEEPFNYKPGKATSEFLRQIYAGQHNSKPFAFDPDWDGDIDSEEPSKYGASASPWKATSDDYKSSYQAKSQPIQKKYEKYDDSDNTNSGNYSSYKPEKANYGKGRDRSSAYNDSDNYNSPLPSKTNREDYTGSLPRRANQQKHADISTADKRDSGKWESKTPSKYSFSQYELGKDLVSNPTKSRFVSKYGGDLSPDRTSTKSGYGSRSLDLDKSPDRNSSKNKYSTAKSDYTSSKPEYTGSKSDFVISKSSSKSDYSSSKSSGKSEKPFTSRFLKKRQEASESGEVKSSGGDKPFQSRFLRKSTGDLTALDEPKPPKLKETESNSTE